MENKFRLLLIILLVLGAGRWWTSRSGSTGGDDDKTIPEAAWGGHGPGPETGEPTGPAAQ